MGSMSTSEGWYLGFLFSAEKKRSGFTKSKSEDGKENVESYQGTPLLFFTTWFSGPSGGMTVGVSVAVLSTPFPFVCRLGTLTSSWSMTPFKSQLVSEEEIKLTGWSSRRWSGGGKDWVEVIVMSVVNAPRILTLQLPRWFKAKSAKEAFIWCEESLFANWLRKKET